MNEGYIAASETLYNLITLGKTFEQSSDGDKKSITVQYIDWENRENNVYHVTEEYSVVRSTCQEHYRPDIVLFINGIPVCVIECKRPDMKNPLEQAISQHLRNQQEDGIRSLYVYSQLTLSLSTQDGAYATNGTPEKFWAKWTEKFENDAEEKQYRAELHEMKNQVVEPEQKDKLFGDQFRYELIS